MLSKVRILYSRKSYIASEQRFATHTSNHIKWYIYILNQHQEGSWTSLHKVVSEVNGNFNETCFIYFVCLHAVKAEQAWANGHTV